jgi:hypothetical protein
MRTSMYPARLRALLVAGLTVLVTTAACSSTTSDPSDPGAPGAPGTPGALKVGDTCTDLTAPCDACKAFSCPCNDGTSAVTCACAGGSCLVERFCPALHACDDHGGPVAQGEPPRPSPDAGPGATCIGMGATGCNTANNPSTCCTDAARPKVVCNGNNDGKGHAQCCVNLGDACATVDDCCGYAALDPATKSHYASSAGKCRLQ